MDGNKHDLPRNIERYLAALAKLYAQDGRRNLQEIVVNAQTRVIEEWTYDNWNGGTYGHALYLVIPDSLFLANAKKRDEIQSEIARDLNGLHNFQNEHIAEVFLEMEVAEDSDWRQESGLLITSIRTVAPESAKRVWGDDGYFRVFLSHKTEVKKQAAELKEALYVIGVSAFVAHEDIHPTRAWQDEIENALHTMDAFVAVMTPGFHDSNWTDQEVGFALARGVPVIALRMGRDPYGFLGKFQALSCDWDSAPEGIVKLLIKYDRMFSSYIRAMRNCTSFDNGNRLARILPNIEKANQQQVDDLVAAYNENSEIRGSFGFNGRSSYSYGAGIIPHLHRLSPLRFTMSKANDLVPAKARHKAPEDEEIPF